MLEKDAGKDAGELALVVAISAIAFLALFSIFYLYRFHFSGDFSTDPGAWSSFGSYFGGVLGPVVSILTLVTVFKTVLLQREMIKIQDETFRSQSAQALLLATDAEQARLDARKTNILSIIEKILSSVSKDMDANAHANFEAVRTMAGMDSVVEIVALGKSIMGMQRQFEVLSGKRDALELLLFKISMKKFSSIDELDAEFSESIRLIRPDLNF